MVPGASRFLTYSITGKQHNMHGSSNRLEPIVTQIRQFIVDRLQPQCPLADFHATTPLFAGGLELNSFAVVELIGLLEQHFQFEFREADFREECFRDVQTLAALVDSFHPAEPPPLAATSLPAGQ